MADFQAQVQGITSLPTLTDDGTTTPTQTELSQFLKDGVMDVTAKWVDIKPGDIQKFQVEHAETTSQGGIAITGKIIRVLRETGTDEDWRGCRMIDPGLQSKVLDIDSMDYASNYNPVFHIDENNKINVFPVPAGSNNAYKVYYVNDTPQNDSGIALIYSHSTIKYFPKELVHVVVLYASIKALEAKMNSYTIDDEDETLVTSLRLIHKQIVDQYETYFNDAKLAIKQQNEKMNALMSQAKGAK